VLDGRRHDGVTTLVRASAPRTEDGDVVGLGAAGGEADLVGVGAEAAGDALAGLVERRAGVATPAVHARRVPEARAVERQHRVEDLGAHGRGGGVVEVDGRGHAENIAAESPYFSPNILPRTSQRTGKKRWLLPKKKNQTWFIFMNWHRAGALIFFMLKK